MSTPVPINIETREDLVSLLYEAAELEHGLCCSYLFAAFSLKDGQAAGLSTDQSEAIGRWRRVILEVAQEEMLHLALVSNLLTAVGAAPHLRRPAFPQRSRYYPAGITVELRRLDDVSLTRFLALERPEDIDVDLDGCGEAELAEDAPTSAPGALRSPAEDEGHAPVEAYATVGQLYEAMARGFGDLVDAVGAENVFIGPPRAQATADHFPFSELVAVTDLDSARQALDVLVVQGEGVRGDWTDAHYGKFFAIREEIRAKRRDDPNFDPAWPVLANPVVFDSAGEVGHRRVDDPLTAAVMQLFNGSYQVMTEMLLRFFARTDEPEAALADLAGSTLALMAEVIGPLGALLPTMPAGSSQPGATAGPSFEFHRSASLLPHRHAAWLIFEERLTELTRFTRRIRLEGGPPVLDGVAEALDGISTRMRHHLHRDPLPQPLS